MPNLTPEERRATQYWGSIEGVTRAGGSVTDLWRGINEQAAALGYDTAGISAIDVNRLRSLAVSNRNAERSLDRLGPDDLITGDAIGQAPWARSLNEQNAVPMWSVRFEHIVIVDGEEVTQYRTSVFTGEVPRTRRELELALEEDGENLAGEYEVEHVGIGGYTILAA